VRGPGGRLHSPALPGLRNEIQAPMAVVILGGLTSSTLLNVLVIPSLFARYARA
jgi:Cu/Ag efflux pump CusA